MFIKSQKIRKCFLCWVLTILLTVSAFATTAFAAKTDSSLTLICESNDASYKNVTFNLYKVAQRNKDGELELCGDFKDYRVSLKDESSSAMQAAADTLENYAVLDKITPDAKKVTDENSSLTFEVKETGLYLVCGVIYMENGVRYIPSPMLVEIKADGNKTEAYPKFKQQIVSSTGVVEYTVTKRWYKDDEHIDERPAAVEVELYKDEVLVETVTLDSTNNWQYSWTSDTESYWRVKEKNVDEDYTVVYKNENGGYYVDNSYHPSDDSSSTEENNPPEENTGSTEENGGKLPQTGLLWWPVPVLALCGLILVSIGCRMNKVNKHKGNK